MVSNIHLPIILGAGFLAAASPGPATMAIAATAMQHGRRNAMAFAAGVNVGSLMWSVAAALGLSALMLANAWAFEVMRYLGASYLLYLAFRSAKAAFSKASTLTSEAESGTLGATFLKGLGLHLTNPKPLLFFSSLFAIGVPQGTPLTVLAVIIAALSIQGVFIFQGFAFLFSIKGVAVFYQRTRRWFDAAFALVFGAASLKLLTAQLFD